MSDGPPGDEMLRRRLTEVAARYADGTPAEGAARARRTARRRAAARTGAVAAAVAAVAIGGSVVAFGPLSTDRSMVTPAVTQAPEPTTTSAAVDPTGGEPSPAPRTTMTTTAPSATTGTVAAGGLPGAPAQVHVPAPGAVLPVVGVEHDDVLNVRSLPGVDGDVVEEVGPTGEVTATGRARDLDGGGRWVEVAVDGTTGWVSGRFLAAGVGGVDDLTSLAVERHAGALTATSLPGLARIVADALATDGSAPDLTTVVAPVSGDLGEITVDWLGLQDDSVLGYRLHVFATEESGVHTLRTVEATTLCARGVTDGGPCT